MVETLTAKPPLDRIALFVYGAYLIDCDLLEEAKPESERAQKLSKKAEAENKIITLCQQWSGEGDGMEYLAAQIRREPETVRQEMIGVLQEVGYIESEDT